MLQLDSHKIILKGLFLLMNLLTPLRSMAPTFQEVTHVGRGGGRMPSFVPGPDNVSVHKGDTAILVCGIDNLGTKTVIWRKASEPNPLTIGESVYVGEGKYTAEPNKENTEWRLVIQDVQTSDAGVYECQISSKFKHIFHILLRVNVTARPERNYVISEKEPPTVDVLPATDDKVIAVTGSKFVEKGDPIRLTCNATGNRAAPMNLDWFKDGIKLASDATGQVWIDKQTWRESNTLVSVLVIQHSRMDDAGTYVCRSDLSITSTKIHVLNAGSTNVRRGTSATDTDEDGVVDSQLHNNNNNNNNNNDDDGLVDTHGGRRTDHKMGDEYHYGGNRKHAHTRDGKKSNNRCSAQSYSSALLCVGLVVVGWLQTRHAAAWWR